jgi:hypothetical protein
MVVVGGGAVEDVDCGADLQTVAEEDVGLDSHEQQCFARWLDLRHSTHLGGSLHPTMR